MDSLIAEYQLFCKEKLAISDETHRGKYQSEYVNELLSQLKALLDESKKILCDQLTMMDFSNEFELQALEDHVLYVDPTSLMSAIYYLHFTLQAI